jgi:hypothetical protein
MFVLTHHSVAEVFLLRPGRAEQLLSAQLSVPMEQQFRL